MPNLSQQFLFALGTGTTTATSVAIPTTAVSSNGNYTFISRPEKGDGYFGSGDGLHTVTFTVTPQFAGTLTMQATLAVDPIEIDWFNVDNSSVTYGSTLTNTVLTTTTNYVNFTGNFVWVRAKVERAAGIPTGSVQFINYNH
jgi:hypothetical protein